MTNYDSEFLGYLLNTCKLAFSWLFWKIALLLVIPIYIVFSINSGFLFVPLLMVSCFAVRSARLGGLVGLFIVFLTVLLFYFDPTADHFIQYTLRAPARALSTVPNVDRVIEIIPKTISGKIFYCFVFGVRGMLIGFGLGMLGRYLLGYTNQMKEFEEYTHCE